jgi:hypothetical protein
MVFGTQKGTGVPQPQSSLTVTLPPPPCTPCTPGTTLTLSLRLCRRWEEYTPMLRGIGLGRDFYDPANWRPDGTPHFATAGALSNTFLLSRGGPDRAPEVFTDTSLGSLQRLAKRKEREAAKAVAAAQHRVELSKTLTEAKRQQLRRARLVGAWLESALLCV